jgi:hypothetical protein
MTAPAENYTTAEAVTRAARRRYHGDDVAHARAELAAHIVETYSGPASREAAIEGAAIALELVERDRPSAEATLERVRQLAAQWLAGPSPTGNTLAVELLDAIRGPA